MATDFPNSPSVNDIFSAGNIRYIWTGTVWNLYSAATDVVSTSTNYSVLKTDNTISASSASGTITITLPTAANISGKLFNIKKSDSSANPVVITTTSSQTIDGQTTQILTYQYECLSVVSNGSNWLIV